MCLHNATCIHLKILDCLLLYAIVSKPYGGYIGRNKMPAPIYVFVEGKQRKQEQYKNLMI